MNTQCYSSARRIGTLENRLQTGVSLLHGLFRSSRCGCASGLLRIWKPCDLVCRRNPNGSEDFNNFTVNTQFRTQPVAVNNMLITGVVGNSGADTNIISVTRDSTSSLYELDSTPFLLGDVEDARRLTFNSPIQSALGGPIFVA